MPRVSTDSEIEIMVRSIVAQYGQAAYSLGEAAKILGTNDKMLKKKLDEHGILVQRMGTRKQISVYDLCAIICNGRVSVYDKTPRREGPLCLTPSVST